MDIRCANPNCHKLYPRVKPGSKASGLFRTRLDCRYANQSKVYFCTPASRKLVKLKPHETVNRDCEEEFLESECDIERKLRGEPDVSLNVIEESIVVAMREHPGFSVLSACQWFADRMTPEAEAYFPALHKVL
jgi:hypothetical protein